MDATGFNAAQLSSGFDWDMNPDLLTYLPIPQAGRGPEGPRVRTIICPLFRALTA